MAPKSNFVASAALALALGLAGCGHSGPAGSVPVRETMGNTYGIEKALTVAITEDHVTVTASSAPSSDVQSVKAIVGYAKSDGNPGPGGGRKHIEQPVSLEVGKGITFQAPDGPGPLVLEIVVKGSSDKGLIFYDHPAAK